MLTLFTNILTAYDMWWNDLRGRFECSISLVRALVVSNQRL